MLSAKPFRTMISFVMLLVLSACGPGGLFSPAATSTPEVRGAPTLPPSWTPGPPPTRPGLGTQPATPPPTATIPLVATVTPLPQVAPETVEPTRRPTLTPPVTRATATSARTQQNVPPTPRPNTTYDAACATFAIISPTDSLIGTNQAARLSWTPVTGAEIYRVWITNPLRRYIFDKTITETKITIPAETFASVGDYRWIIMPIKDNGRMCLNLEGVFSVRLGG